MIDRLPWGHCIDCGSGIINVSVKPTVPWAVYINPDNALYISNYYIISGISQQIFPKTVIALNPC
jgi:hypothetical protein